ncbi:SIS domain-containing protein [Methylobacterium persicinum]|uniref:D-sedoheptulose 7-phosphate isomerase n=1 Tax=Methylobacterium persicinum TaxID=374426 RepID=A0ABU0HND8_9HYPH|nr:SIS domain-containing protein [Methylobacterium persicinum]MDQ0443009.1 D-sedoheptulose 7-phosphate isomerase [Methylobacterium persicinum]GJE40200.1 Phosphoheptose isomerase [Methylobacterium persicinum]
MLMQSSDYLTRLTALLAQVDRSEFDRGVALVRDAWISGRQIITLGNGGSAMTALHFMTDWTKMTFLAHGKPFLGRSLVDNMGLITAYANDLSYQDVFSAQLRNIAAKNDLVIAISGSGNSENVIRAIDVANEMGCQTLGLCGFSGGRLKERAANVIWVNSNDMQLVEDVHSVFGHIVMQALCHAEALQ